MWPYRAQCVLHLDRLLEQLCHFGRQRADLVVLGDVVRCLPRLIALIAQATELLNLVGILSKAGRLEDNSAAPSRCSGSGFGVRGAAGSARIGPAGLGQRSLAQHLVPGIAPGTAAPIRGDRVTWAFLTLAWHVGHLQWPSRPLLEWSFCKAKWAFHPLFSPDLERGGLY